LAWLAADRVREDLTKQGRAPGWSRLLVDWVELHLGPLSSLWHNFVLIETHVAQCPGVSIFDTSYNLQEAGAQIEGELRAAV